MGSIGIFDSGVGGLSVLRHIRAQLPDENLLYFADQAHVPYGSRSAQEIRHFSREITDFLLVRGAKLIVVACNAASAAALDYLRDAFPHTPIVGMEPAVKPAATQTKTGKVGVLATPGTFNSHRYASLMERFAKDIRVYEDPCRGLVELIEAGEVAAPETEALLRGVVTPMLSAGVDTLVLGCTHYPFVQPLLRQIAGEDVAIIDPAPAVARRAANVLQHHQLQSPDSRAGVLRCFTTGEASRLAELGSLLLGLPCLTEQARWQGSHLATA